MTTRKHNITPIEYEDILRDHPSDDAILFLIDGEKVWLPRSEIEVDCEENQVHMPDWMAIEKELV